MIACKLPAHLIAALSIPIFFFFGCTVPTSSEGDAYDTEAKSESTSIEDEMPAAEPGSPRRPVAVELAPRASPPVDDLPVPMGVRLVESVSRNYESAAGRYVDHNYEGRVDKFAVERFYRRHMPLNGWTLRSSEMVRGEFNYTFVKGGEEAIIKIWDKKGSFNLTPTVVIRLDLHPVGAAEKTSLRF